MKRLVPAVVLLAVLGTSLALAALAAADDGQATQTALAGLATMAGNDAGTPVAASLVQRAQDALERARRMRAAGDDPHARLAEATAREWASAATELTRAAETERRAEAARRGALDAGAQADRERALLEEAHAHNGRLRAQLDRAAHETREGHATPPKGGHPRVDAGGAP